MSADYDAVKTWTAYLLRDPGSDDAFDRMSAAEFLAFARPPGSPSRAAELLAGADLLDVEALDVETLQCHPTEWCEEW